MEKQRRSYSTEALKALDASDLRRMARATSWSKPDRTFVAGLLGLQADINPAMLSNFGRRLLDRLGPISSDDAMRLSMLLSRPVYEARARHGLGGERIDLAQLESGVERLLESFSSGDVRLYLAHFADIGRDQGASEGTYEERLMRRCRILLHSEALLLDVWLGWEVPKMSPAEEALDGPDPEIDFGSGGSQQSYSVTDEARAQYSLDSEPATDWRIRLRALDSIREDVAGAMEETARSLEAGRVPGTSFEEARRRLADETASLIADIRAVIEQEGMDPVGLDSPSELSKAVDELEGILRQRKAADALTYEVAQQVQRLGEIESAIPLLGGFSVQVQEVIRSALADLDGDKLWDDEDLAVVLMLQKVAEVHSAALSSDTATAIRIAQDCPVGSPFSDALVEAAETNRWAEDPDEQSTRAESGDGTDAETPSLLDQARDGVPRSFGKSREVAEATPAETGDGWPAGAVDEPDERALPNESSVAKCIQAGELGLAYWVARASEWPKERYRVLAAAAYASAIESEDDEAASGYARFIGGFSIKGLEDNRGLQLLALSAAVRATLFAPYRGAADVLSGLENSLGDPAPSALITELKHNIGVPILAGAQDPGDDSAEGIEERIKHAVHEARRAQETMRDRRSFLPRANNVWRRCLGDAEPLGQLLNRVQSDDRSSVEEIAEHLRIARDSADTIINATDVAIARRGLRGDIVGDPRDWLHRNFDELFDLVDRWVKDVRKLYRLSSAPAEGVAQRVQSLRGSLRELRDPVLKWLEAESRKAESEGRQLRIAGITAARRLLDVTLAAALDGGGGGQRNGLDLDPLHRPILRACDIPFSEFVERDRNDEILGWLDANRAAAALETTLIQALEARTAANECRAAWLLLDELIESGADEAEILRLQTLVDDRSTEADRMLESLLDHCEQRLSHARQQQHFSLHDARQQGFEEEFRLLRSEVRALMEARDHPLASRAIDGFVSRLDDELDSSRASLHADLTEAIEQQRAIGTEEGRIRSVIDAGDLETARELIRLAQDGKALPVEPEGSGRGFDRLRVFCEHVLPVFEQQGPGADQLLRSIVDQREPSRELPIDFSQTSEQVKAIAERGMSAWLTIQAAESNTAGVRWLKEGLHDAVRDILLMLGLTMPKQKLHQERDTSGRSVTWFDIEQARITGSVTAHQFGSSARGRYSVLLVSHRPEPSFIVDQIQEHGGSAPVIVLYLGVLSRDHRRRLANESRQRLLRPAVVVDEAVAAMLAAGSGRLQDTLALTLPFSWLEPYNPFAHAFVPEEVFAGRDAELQAITSDGTTHFIYGGRQLGKSALLKAAQRKFQSEDHRTVYIDTKARHIGSIYPANHIIRVVTEHLEEAGIPISATGVAGEAEVLRRSVREWLAQNANRRLLILLDEVDEFLQDDEPRFEMVDYFRSLYGDTDRRAKPIFAGLHSVQRFLSHTNNPFPHLGRHLEIGPLATGPATNLVVGPLAALGLRFESPDLVARFLRQTNYHPGLIQIYCYTLVKHMSIKPLTADEPPQIISSADVYRVFVDQELVSLVRDRFNLTIGLDDRYRVIAYALALRALTESMVDGITIEALLDDCSHYWPNGFPRRERTEFEVLLKEMVGLGVLSVNASRRYLFRAPNIVELLGDAEEIVQTLDSAKEKRLVQRYDLAVFRSLHGDRRLPLSELAMRNVLGVSQDKSRLWTVLGSAATSSDIMLDAIRESAGSHNLRSPKRLRAIARLEGEAAKAQPDEGMSRFLIDLSAKGPEEVRAALDAMRSTVSGHGHVSVVALVGPTAIEAWASIRRIEADEGDLAVAQLSRMSDASIQAWGRHIDRPLDDERALRAVREATGGWPILIDMLYRYSIEGMPWSEALQETTNRYCDSKGAAEFVQKVGLRPDSMHGHLFDMLVQLGEYFPLEELVDYFAAEPRFAGHNVREMLDDLIALQVLDELSIGSAAGSDERPVLKPEPRYSAAWAVTQ